VHMYNLNTQVSFVRANSEANGTQIAGPAAKREGVESNLI